MNALIGLNLLKEQNLCNWWKCTICSFPDVAHQEEK